jgi:hypothetical protein
MNFNSRRHVFHFLGGSIVILWLVLLGVLVKRVNVNGLGNPTGGVNEKVTTTLSSQREWMEIYLKNNKVGYSMRQVDPYGENYRIRDEIVLNLNLMGQPVGIQSITVSVVDQRFLLKEFNFSIHSGAVTFVTTGHVEGKWMQLEIGEGPVKRTERIHLANPPMIGSALAQLFKGRVLHLGQSFEFPIFDPSTLARKEVVLEVIARETVSIRHNEYKAFRIETEMWGQPMTFWVDESGNVLKEQGFMGLTLIKCSADVARRNMGGSAGDDFYDLVAVNVNEKLQKPHNLTYLKLRVTGVNEGQLDMNAMNGGRQTFQSGMIEVVQEQVPVDPSYTLPRKESFDKMKAFLGPEYNIQSDHEIVINKSREIAGEETDVFAVAQRLMTWVYRNVDKRPVVSVPSALEVLRTRTGDCNEHSVLLTALLRSAGIPARINVGLVYVRGKFFYHAWTEAYLGKWISMDSILNQMPTDATHIKMTEGDLQRQVDMIGLMGKLNLEIVDYRYD